MAYSQVQSAPPERSLGIEAYPDARDLYAFAESQRVKYDWPAFGVGVIFRGKIVALGMAGERRIRTGDWATLLRYGVSQNIRPARNTTIAMTAISSPAV